MCIEHIQQLEGNVGSSIGIWSNYISYINVRCGVSMVIMTNDISLYIPRKTYIAIIATIASEIIVDILLRPVMMT